jgi:hypothetical protein
MGALEAHQRRVGEQRRQALAQIERHHLIGGPVHDQHRHRDAVGLLCGLEAITHQQPHWQERKGPRPDVGQRGVRGDQDHPPPHPTPGQLDGDAGAQGLTRQHQVLRLDLEGPCHVLHGCERGVDDRVLRRAALVRSERIARVLHGDEAEALPRELVGEPLGVTDLGAVAVKVQHHGSARGRRRAHHQHRLGQLDDRRRRAGSSHPLRRWKHELALRDEDQRQQGQVRADHRCARHQHHAPHSQTQPTPPSKEDVGREPENAVAFSSRRTPRRRSAWGSRLPASPSRRAA